MFKLKSFIWTAERFFYASTCDFLNANSVMSGKEKAGAVIVRIEKVGYRLAA